MHHNLAYFPYLFVGMAAFFLIIGIRVTIANRPLFLPAKYFFIFMLFAILPQAINMAYAYAYAEAYAHSKAKAVPSHEQQQASRWVRMLPPSAPATF